MNVRQWEYLTVELRTISGWGTTMLNPSDLAEELNQYGREGWDLVAALPLDTDGQTVKVAAILKRRGGVVEL